MACFKGPRIQIQIQIQIQMAAAALRGARSTEPGFDLAGGDGYFS
jgi:hypothetical protein